MRSKSLHGTDGMRMSRTKMERSTTHFMKKIRDSVRDISGSIRIRDSVRDARGSIRLRYSVRDVRGSIRANMKNRPKSIGE